GSADHTSPRAARFRGRLGPAANLCGVTWAVLSVAFGDTRGQASAKRGNLLLLRRLLQLLRVVREMAGVLAEGDDPMADHRVGDAGFAVEVDLQGGVFGILALVVDDSHELAVEVVAVDVLQRQLAVVDV